MQETGVQSLGREDPLQKEMATRSSTVAWKIPWTKEPGRLQSMGSQRVGHDWATTLHFFYLLIMGALYLLSFIWTEVKLFCWTDLSQKDIGIHIRGHRIREQTDISKRRWNIPWFPLLITVSFADPFFNLHHHSVDFWSILFSDLLACLWLLTVQCLHHRPSNISKAYILSWVSISGFLNRNQSTWTSIPNLLGLDHFCLYNAASLCSPRGPSLCSLCLCLTQAKLILISLSL